MFAKKATLICFQVCKIFWQIATFVDTKVLFVIMSRDLKGLAINFCLYFSENKILKREIFGSFIPLQRI